MDHDIAGPEDSVYYALLSRIPDDIIQQVGETYDRNRVNLQDHCECLVAWAVRFAAAPMLGETPERTLQAIPEYDYEDGLFEKIATAIIRRRAYRQIDAMCRYLLIERAPSDVIIDSDDGDVAPYPLFAAMLFGGELADWNEFYWNGGDEPDELEPTAIRAMFRIRRAEITQEVAGV